MSPKSFWRSAVAIGISVAAIWTVADVIAAVVGLPLAAGLDWATAAARACGILTPFASPAAIRRPVIASQTCGHAFGERGWRRQPADGCLAHAIGASETGLHSALRKPLQHFLPLVRRQGLGTARSYPQGSLISNAARL
jgi:hypothetical protein